MISAKVIAASVNTQGDKIVSMEVVMPRYILAEFNTHRMFSRNSASSRAIPSKKMLETVKNTPFVPIAWQKDHSGMQGTEYFEGSEVDGMIANHHLAKQEAIERSTICGMLGVTKQISNRYLEPFMYHKVLLTSTDWENFFTLRCPQYDIAGTLYRSKRDVYKVYTPVSKGGISGILEENDFNWFRLNKGQADIHMMALAEAMYDAYQTANFVKLSPGEWHMPYVEYINNRELDTIIRKYNNENPFVANLPEGIEFDYNTRLVYWIMISAARCARLSYQTLGDNPKIDYEADIKLYSTLAKNGHFSPFEHVAKVMTEEEYEVCVRTILDPITGNFKIEKGWFKNFRGFIQQRGYLELQSS